MPGKCRSLLSDTAQELTEPGQIRARAAEFYSLLFQSEYKETDNQLKEFCSGLTQVSEDTNTSLDCLLTLQERHAALQTMQNWKAPGIEGLSEEFYKLYWDILGSVLLNVFNESLESGPLGIWCLFSSLLSDSGDAAEGGYAEGHPPMPDLLCGQQDHSRQCLPHSGCSKYLQLIR